MELFKTRKYIRQRIENLFATRGVNISIGELEIVSLNKLYLKQVALVNKNLESQFFEIDSILLNVSVWRSVLYFALVGEMRILGIHGEIDFVSINPFIVDQLIFTFKIRTRTKLVFMELEGISIFFQKIDKKQISEVYIELIDISWNDIICMLQDHLMSDVLKNSYSEDKLSIYCYQKKMKNTKSSIPFFNACIKYNELSLYHKDFLSQKENEIWVDDAYLRKTLMGKINKDKARNYIPLDRLSKNLINAVICTEDPDFWNHHGISPSYIGYALQKNIEQKKIVRGASTITMQLVRNLFLSHNRTWARKAEESIIVLLLENYYKISKETIIELYLNIIEFAPGVYGIGEASIYYFGKNHSELSLMEILTLTYIIPRPKYFYEALCKETLQLKTNLYNHISVYFSVMLKKNIIQATDQNSIDYKIQFAPVFGTFDLKKTEVK